MVTRDFGMFPTVKQSPPGASHQTSRPCDPWTTRLGLVLRTLSIRFNSLCANTRLDVLVLRTSLNSLRPSFNSKAPDFTALPRNKQRCYPVMGLSISRFNYYFSSTCQIQYNLDLFYKTFVAKKRGWSIFSLSRR